ncbi:hypothetical protein JCM11641_001988 [Rhodosporidiobolus odoratus]
MPKESKPRATKASGGKAKKDPNAPKRPLSAYMIFTQDERPKLKEEQPDVKFGEVGKILGARWKELDADEKKPWEEKAKVAKAKYEKEKAAYDAENPSEKPASKPKKAPAKKSKKKVESEEEEEEEASADDKIEEDEEEEDDEE